MDGKLLKKMMISFNMRTVRSIEWKTPCKIMISFNMRTVRGDEWKTP